MIETKWKEVDFATYCPKCEYEELPDWKDPCCECMDTGMRVGTWVPENFEERGKK